MKLRVLTTILAAAFIFTNLEATAQQKVDIEKSVKQMAAEFDNTKGVDCMVIDQGASLGMIKAAFKPKFGKEFMKDVTSMIIIEYSNATAEVRSAIRAKIESITAHLQDFSPGNGESKDGQYTKGYATINGTTSISDFMIVMEDDDNKMFLYMGGVLNIEKMELNM